MTNEPIVDKAALLVYFAFPTALRQANQIGHKTSITALGAQNGIIKIPSTSLSRQNNLALLNPSFSNRCTTGGWDLISPRL